MAQNKFKTNYQQITVLICMVKSKQGPQNLQFDQQLVGKFIHDILTSVDVIPSTYVAHRRHVAIHFLKQLHYPTAMIVVTIPVSVTMKY